MSPGFVDWLFLGRLRCFRHFRPFALSARLSSQCAAQKLAKNIRADRNIKKGKFSIIRRICARNRRSSTPEVCNNQPDDCQTPGPGFAGWPSKIVHASDIFLPWGRPRAGRIADEPGPMSYYQCAETVVAAGLGLAFALVGWWDIIGSIWSALQ